MTFRNPIGMQEAGPVLDAVDFRLALAAISAALGGPGVLGASSLQVATATTGATPSVLVAAGGAFVGAAGDSEGDWFVYNDTPYTLALAAPHATLTRIDIVVAQVHDNALDAGGSNSWAVEKVTGTPGGAAPAVPDNALLLSTVTVSANGTTVACAEGRVILPGSIEVSGQLDVAADIVGAAAVQAALGGLFAHCAVLPNSGSWLLVHDSLLANKDTDYALQQSSVGEVYHNHKAGHVTHFREGNDPTDLLNFSQGGGVSIINIAHGLPVAVGGELLVAFTPGSGKLVKVTSARKYKERERALLEEVDPLTVLSQIVPKLFGMKDAPEGTRDLAGFIADDVADVYEQGVVRDEAGEPEALDVWGMVSLLWSAVQFLAVKVEALST